MDHVRERRDQAEGKRAQIEPGSAASDAEGDERCDGEAGDTVAAEVLRPKLVVTQQLKLKQRWKRPNDNSGEKSKVSARNAGGLPERGRTGGTEEKKFPAFGFYWLVGLYRAIR